MNHISRWIWKIGAIIVVLWLLSVAFITPPSLLPSNDPDPKLAYRLRKAVQELDILKKQNDDIKKVLKDFTNKVEGLGDNSSGKDKTSIIIDSLQKKLEEAHKVLQKPPVGKADFNEIVPSLEFEQTRRLLDNGLQESWWYLIAQFKNLKKKSSSDDAKAMQKLIDETKDRIRVMQYDLSNLSNADGLRNWREKESTDLGSLVQKRLHHLQNPTDCAHAKKLVCNLNKGCGYGCQIHHLVYCFIVAYGTKRTLIVKSKGWRYNRNGWDDVFQPFSDTCTDPGGVSHGHWPGTEKTQVLELPIIDTLSQRPNFLPLSIPDDLSERIMRLHGNPAAWWVGQFLKYMLKYQPKIQDYLDSMKQNIDFKGPIVGIHIRRTDKVGTEAAFHPIEEYMEHVKDYFDLLSLKGEKMERRVYIASDDPSVLSEAIKKFPDYIFLGDSGIAKTAAVATRYTDASLRGIIADIHFLSLTDYIVCTFSSQVCRIAYEIMQSLHPDASKSVRSLDDVYYYGGQSAHNQKARFAHVAARTEEMSFQKGDLVGVAGNHYDGYNLGLNRRSRHNALYPSYKMVEVVDKAKMPTYAEVDAL